ncbi:MAG: hypothetical protein IPK44_15755 [Candidatus Accumulibacter sp.]|uniref:hypothetical protein n=1 Tax=Accumulibacter sp. TaxID=2053492 RepID=UPI00258CA596|nr:hypothetical protein [Accumulibacter sp.]MBK8115835.1 hypothetical protein [Accumulibacter sp.]
METQLINYAVIDCLPALSVLRGAEDSMAMWDVIIARVVLDEAQLAGQGARKSEVDRYLSKPEAISSSLLTRRISPLSGVPFTSGTGRDCFSAAATSSEPKRES